MDTGINATTNTNGASDINIASSGNVTGQRMGISAENFSTVNNSVSVTTTGGQITATDYNGINANNARAESNNVIINTTDGMISGYRRGLNAINNGYGTITLTTSGGSITGATETGIYARNYDAGGDINITTNGSTINGLLNGIRARNDSTVGASVNITSSSDITSDLGSAISASNSSEGSQNITVMATGGNIEGSDRGISVNNSGTGTTIVDASAYITSTADFGSAVDVRAQSSSADIMITSNGTLVGGGSGISVENNSDANNSITINTTGNITGSTQPGIQAENNNVSSLNLSIDTGLGTINGATSAIVANNYGTGTTNVTTGGQVTGGQTGISVRNNANAGDINVSTTGGNVTGDSTRGIDISNYSEQSGSINLNISGDVTSTQGSAIFARSVSSSSYGITVNIGAGDIIGERTGVSAGHEGSGPVTIINNGNITGNNIVGLNATSAGPAIEITNTGNVTGGSFGISAFSTNNGDITINTSGTVSATAFAINTYSSNPSDADVVIDINPGSIINGIIRNEAMDATVTIADNTTINGNISLGFGNDALNINGGDLSAVTNIDGGGDLAGGTSFIDAVTFNDTTQTLRPNNFAGWETMAINNGSVITFSSPIPPSVLMVDNLLIDNSSTLSLTDGTINDPLSITAQVQFNGTIALDVLLQNNAAPSGGIVTQADHIFISGDTSGNADIVLNDLGSLAGLTSSQGVLLIENQGVAKANFTLSTPFSVGDFDYKLIQDNNNWFLRSPEVDVSIDVNLLSQEPFEVGDKVIYQIEVSNNGPDNAKNIIVDGISSNLDFVSLSSSGCSPAQLPCTIETLASGESQNLTYRATINSAGFFRLNSSVQVTTEIDLNPVDNTDNIGNGGSTEPLLIPTLNTWAQLILAMFMSLTAAFSFSRNKEKN